ncbi:MAG TPA: hypothetical protein VGP50_02090 [Stellaceae bacterium]|nr:hypothetical protein [Stellaceae bacterium]
MREAGIDLGPDEIAIGLIEHARDRLPDQFAHAIIELLRGRGVDRQERTRRIENEVHRRIALEGGSPLLLDLLAGMLGPLAVGDVLVARQDRCRRAALVALQRPTACHDDLAAIPPRLHELAFPPAATHDVALDLLEGPREGRLQQRVDDFADRLLRRPSVERLGGAIPGADDSVHIAHENAVMHEVQQVGLRPQNRFGPPRVGLTRDANGFRVRRGGRAKKRVLVIPGHDGSPPKGSSAAYRAAPPPHKVPAASFGRASASHFGAMRLSRQAAWRDAFPVARDSAGTLDSPHRPSYGKTGALR